MKIGGGGGDVPQHITWTINLGVKNIFMPTAAAHLRHLTEATISERGEAPISLKLIP